MAEFLDQVYEALESGDKLAFITLVRSFGSTPRHKSARLAVFADGRTLGSIGGGTMELQAIANAQSALVEGKPGLIEYNLNGRGEGNVGLCGGTQEVFIDVLDPAQKNNGHDGANVEPLQIVSAIRRALTDGEPAILATIIRTDREESLRLGTRMVVLPAGITIGSLGDTLLDGAVVQETHRVLADGYAHRLGFDPAVGAMRRLTATRRAPVEVLLDLFEPRPRLLIIGTGHIGAALARVGKFLGWWVSVVDDRPAFLTREHLPDVDETHQVHYDSATEQLDPLNVRVTPGTAVVAATWGWDEPALRQLAGGPAFYTGLVASPRKAAVIFQSLKDEGIDPVWLNNVRVPVGLDIGAESPEEIALAIMAEILAVQRKKSGRPLRAVKSERGALPFDRPTTVVEPTEVTRKINDDV
jgi:xanthine dehydrogenase accessory factor